MKRTYDSPQNWRRRKFLVINFYSSSFLFLYFFSGRRDKFSLHVPFLPISPMTCQSFRFCVNVYRHNTNDSSSLRAIAGGKRKWEENYYSQWHKWWKIFISSVARFSCPCYCAIFNSRYKNSYQLRNKRNWIIFRINILFMTQIYEKHENFFHGTRLFFTCSLIRDLRVASM